MTGTRTLQFKISGDASGGIHAIGEMQHKTDLLGSVVQGFATSAGMAIGNFVMDAGQKLATFAFDAVNKFADYGVQVGKFQRLTGMTAEDSSRLVLFARESGVSVDSLAAAVKRFDKNLSAGTVDGYKEALVAQGKSAKAAEAATEGLAKAQQHLADLQVLQSQKAKLTTQDQIAMRDAQAKVVEEQKKLSEASLGNIQDFNDLGIVVRDSEGKLLPFKEILANTADVFEKYGEGPESAALAQKLFGKSGTDLLPILLGGGDAVRDSMEAVDKYAITLDKFGVKDARDAKKAQRELSLAWDAAQIILGQALAPILIQVVGWIGEQLPKALQTAKQWLNDHKEDIKHVGEAIVNAFIWAKDHLPGILDNVKDKLNGVAEAVGKVIAWWTEHVGTWEDFHNGLNKIGDAANSVKGFLDPIIGTLQDIVHWFDELNKKIDQIKGNGGAGNNNADIGQFLFHGPLGMFKSVFDTVTNQAQPHAGGGSLSSGWNLVGEAGPELIPPGNGGRDVIPAGPSAAMLSGGGDIHITVEIDGHAVGHAIHRKDMALA